MDETKVFWKSKTFWTNIVSGAVLLVGQTQVAQVTPNEASALAGLVIVANLILRLVTKGKVTLS